MKEQFRGFGKIFSFTFLQHVKSKGYKNTTIAVALLCLLIPVLVMAGGEALSGNDASPEAGRPSASTSDVESEMPSEGDSEGASEESPADTSGETPADTSGETPADMDISGIAEIMLVDRSSDGLAELSGFGDYLAENGGTPVKMTDFGKDFEAARKAAEARDDALLLVADQVGKDFELNLLTPSKAAYSEGAAEVVRSYLYDYSFIMKEALAVQGAEDGAGDGSGDGAGDGASGGAGDGSGDGSEGAASGGEPGYEEESEEDSLRGIVTMLVAFLNIMVLYFFVLIYGQGVATSVVMEKASKLMEVFLISVKPPAMIMGKMVATALSGILQLFSWIAALILGVTLGGMAERMINPDAGNIMKEIMDLVSIVTNGLFSPAGVIVAILMAFSGIFLYCALAGIGGSLASKQEDLSSTNLIFTMIILISFFAVMYGGGVPGIGTDIGFIKATMDWIPFTAVMIMPAKILLGTVSVAKGLASLAIVLVTTVLLTIIGGKIYKAMALYRGKVLSPKSVFRMVSGK